MLDFASSSERDDADEGPSAPDTELLDAYSHAVTGVDDLIRLLNAERIGRKLTIGVLRRGQLRTFDVAPLERPVAKAA